MATTPQNTPVSVTNNTDDTAPSVTFSPANGARTNAKSADLTLTFDEAVYKDANGAEFGASDLESLIELKVTDDNGSVISFSASINAANTIVTINPSSDLSDGDVYVEVGSGFYDGDGNQGSETSATFTVDTVVPTISSVAVVNGTTLTLTFSENMKTTPLPAATQFTVSVDSGTAPTVSALSITDATATLTLDSAMKATQTVTLTYTKPGTNPLADLAGNELAPLSVQLPALSAQLLSPPTVAFKLGDVALSGTVVSADSDGNIVLTFSEAVYADASTTAFTSDTVDDIITLTEDDADGDAIGFAVTVTTSGSNANKVVTINPSSDLDDGVVYVAVSNAYYDAQGNQGAAANVTFTIDTTAPTVSFKLGDVALTGTVYSNDSDGNIVLTFSEAVYADATTTAFTSDTVDDIITLTEDDADGDAIGFAVTVTTSGSNANKVVTINPSSDLDDGVVYVAVSNGFYDAQGNQGAAANVTFTIDTTAPTVTFSPANGARTNAKSAQPHADVQRGGLQGRFAGHVRSERPGLAH